MLPDDCRVETPARDSIVKPYCLSHGTLECVNLAESRKFYEEFLGLECVRHAMPAMAFRLGMRFHVVCVEVGDQVHPTNVLNHWGIDVGSHEAVDLAHGAAWANKDRFKIRQVLPVQEMHGVYSFYMEDLDHNWWEIQHYANGFQHDDFFDFGDRFSDQERADPKELTELATRNA